MMVDDPTPKEPQEPKESQDQDQDAQKKTNKVQDRINKLYGQKKEAEEYSANLETENEKLRSQMLELQQSVDNIKAGQGGENQAGPTAPDDGGNAGNLNAEQIKSIVQNSVGEIFSQREKKAQEVQQLQQAHVKSWRKAIEDMPELKDQKTDLYQASQRVWEQDEELRNSPNGPLKAAIMARGFIGSDGVTQQERNAAAQEQGVVNENINSTSEKKELDEINTEMAQLQQKMAMSAPIGQTWPRFKELKVKKAEILAKKKKE